MSRYLTKGVNVTEPNDQQQGLLSDGEPPEQDFNPLAVRKAALLTATIGLIHRSC